MKGRECLLRRTKRSQAGGGNSISQRVDDKGRGSQKRTRQPQGWAGDGGGSGGKLRGVRRTRRTPKVQSVEALSG